MSAIRDSNEAPQSAPQPAEEQATVPQPAAPAPVPKEIGGRGGLDPVRYGDWEKNGRCIDF
jgi:hypothetical protein